MHNIKNIAVYCIVVAAAIATIIASFTVYPKQDHPDTSAAGVTTSAAPDGSLPEAEETAHEHVCSESVTAAIGKADYCTVTYVVCECGQTEIVDLSASHVLTSSEPYVQYNDDGTARVYVVGHTCEICDYRFTRLFSDDEILDFGLPSIEEINNEAAPPRSEPSEEEPAIPDHSDHSYGDWMIAKAATCGINGYMTRECSVCHKVEKQILSATGHEWGAGKFNVEPQDCTHDFAFVRSCTICNGKLVAMVYGHSYGDWIFAGTPDCRTDGLLTRECADCHQVEEMTVHATGHDWGEWVVINAPTDSLPGIETRACATCKSTETRKISTLSD